MSDAGEGSAREAREPIGNWPRRILAALLWIAGAVGAVAVVFLMRNIMEGVEVSLLSVSVWKCFSVAIGFVVLCGFNIRFAHVIVGENDTEFGIVTGVGFLVDSVRNRRDQVEVFVHYLLMPIFIMTMAVIAMLFVVGGTRVPGAEWVALLYLLPSVTPFWAAIESRFQIGKRLEAWNRRVGFSRSIEETTKRWDESWDITTRAELWKDRVLAYGALLLGVAVVAAVAVGAGEPPGENSSSAREVFEGKLMLFILPFAMTAGWIIFGESARRMNDDKQTYLARDSVRAGLNCGLVTFLGGVGGNIIYFIAYLIGLVMWPIGAIIAFVVGGIAFVAMQIRLRNLWSHFLTEQEEEEAANAGSEPDAQRTGEQTPAPDEATVDELFAEPGEIVQKEPAKE